MRNNLFVRTIFLILFYSNFVLAICEKFEVPIGKRLKCKSNDECVVGDDECRWPIALNSTYSSDVKNFNTCIRPAIKCAPYTGRISRGELSSICFLGECTLKTSEKNAKDKTCDLRGLLYGEIGPTGTYKHCYQGSIVSGVVDSKPTK